MRSAALVRRIDRELRAAGAPRRAAHAGGYTPSGDRHYGVAVPPMRRIARTVARELRDAPAADVIDLADALVDTGVFDCRSVAYEVLMAHQAAFAALNATALERLGRGLDNWASVDSFARGLSGPVWVRGGISDARVDRWARSRDFWWRRVAVVSTVAWNEKRHGGDAARTLHVCARLIDDREEFVVKALSWALRSLAERDPRAVEAFIAEHEERLAARVLREVRHKLRTGRKNPRRAALGSAG